MPNINVNSATSKVLLHKAMEETFGGSIDGTIKDGWTAYGNSYDALSVLAIDVSGKESTEAVKAKLELFYALVTEKVLEVAEPMQDGLQNFLKNYYKNLCIKSGIGDDGMEFNGLAPDPKVEKYRSLILLYKSLTETFGTNMNAACAGFESRLCVLAADISIAQSMEAVEAKLKLFQGLVNKGGLNSENGLRINSLMQNGIEDLIKRYHENLCIESGMKRSRIFSDLAPGR